MPRTSMTFAEYFQARAEAAASLERIADQFPDVFDEFVRFRRREQDVGINDPEDSEPERVHVQVEMDSRFAGKTIPEAAEIVLREAARPLRTAEIAIKLQEAGVGVGNPNFKNAIFTSLTRREDLFVKVHPGVWSVRHLEQNSPE